MQPLLKPRTPANIVHIVTQKEQLRQKLEKRIEEEGLVVRDKNGSVIEHPCIKTLKKTEDELLTIYKTYGA